MNQTPEINDALNTLRYAILGALLDIGDDSAMTLLRLEISTNIPRETLRGIIADLRGDGLVMHVRGLCNDGGMFAGSGYAITQTGVEHISEPKVGAP